MTLPFLAWGLWHGAGLTVHKLWSDRTRKWWTAKLLELLNAYRGHSAIAIVTHKGFLREFEHGPLGRPQATEFGNCEVRVYRLELGAAEHLHITRIHPPEPPPHKLQGTDWSWDAPSLAWVPHAQHTRRDKELSEFLPFIHLHRKSTML